MGGHLLQEGGPAGVEGLKRERTSVLRAGLRAQLSPLLEM